MGEFVAVYVKSVQIGTDTWQPQRNVAIVKPGETVAELFKRCWPHATEPSGLSVEIVAVDKEGTHD